MASTQRSHPRTLPSAPSPAVIRGWVNQCADGDADAWYQQMRPHPERIIPCLQHVISLSSSGFDDLITRNITMDAMMPRMDQESDAWHDALCRHLQPSSTAISMRFDDLWLEHTRHPRTWGRILAPTAKIPTRVCTDGDDGVVPCLRGSFVDIHRIIQGVDAKLHDPSVPDLTDDLKHLSTRLASRIHHSLDDASWNRVLLFRDLCAHHLTTTGKPSDGFGCASYLDPRIWSSFPQWSNQVVRIVSSSKRTDRLHIGHVCRMLHDLGHVMPAPPGSGPWIHRLIDGWDRACGRASGSTGTDGWHDHLHTCMGSHWLDRSHRSRLIGIHMRIQQTSRHHAPRDLMPASVFRWYRHWSEVFATDHGVHQAARYGMTESQMMTLVSFDDPHVMVGEVARIQAIAPAYADPPSTTDAP